MKKLMTKAMTIRVKMRMMMGKVKKTRRRKMK